MKRFFISLLMLSVIFTSTTFAKEDKLTKLQTALMIQVFNIWNQIGYPETGEAILLQETMAGAVGNGVGDRHQPVGKRSYGPMQVKVSTTRFVFANFPEMKEEYFPGKNMANVADEELIVKLITDSEFNILIASKNFYLMIMYAKNDWNRAVASYNAGWGVGRTLNHPNQFPYVKSVDSRIYRTVRQFNKDHNLY